MTGNFDWCWSIHRGAVPSWVRGICSSILLSVLMLGLLTGCGARSRTGNRAPSLPLRPIMVWISSDFAASIQTEGMPALAGRLRQAGVTHLALEVVDRNGSSSADRFGPVREAASKAGLATAAVLPAFVPRLPEDQLLLSQAGVWAEGTWQVRPLEPPRLSPVHEESIARLAEQLAGIGDPIVVLGGFGFESSEADISLEARRAYESWAAQSVRDWPAEVLGSGMPTLPWGPTDRGPLWNSWTYWRADLMRRHLIRLRSITAAKGQALAVLVDAPYSVHQRLGLNWAAGTVTAAEDYPWLPPAYTGTAAGHLADAIILGYWEPTLIRREQALERGYAWWASVEGSTVSAGRIIPDGVARWGAVVVDDGANWPLAVRSASRLNSGLLLIPTDGFLMDPASIELLGLALRQ